MNKETLVLSRSLSARDKRFLQRLPSVKSRSMNIDNLTLSNEVLVLRCSKSNRVAILAYYYCFDDFIYVHSLIGRDEYKTLFFGCLFDVTTGLGDTYFVLFNSVESISSTEFYGGREVLLDEIDHEIPDFVDRLKQHTGLGFYREGNKLKDDADQVGDENPIYLITKERYMKKNIRI